MEEFIIVFEKDGNWEAKVRFSLLIRQQQNGIINNSLSIIIDKHAKHDMALDFHLSLSDPRLLNWIPAVKVISS
jgi:predicted FMN-binding regulatory protein PaiB